MGHVQTKLSEGEKLIKRSISLEAKKTAHGVGQEEEEDVLGGLIETKTKFLLFPAQP